jgi:hypothetical protein
MLMMSAQVWAGPMAVWDTQWNARLIPVTEIANASAKNDFGPRGKAGTPLPEVTGVAKAYANVGADNGFFGFGSHQSYAQAIVKFERTFTLTDSPGGWTVTLDAHLTGMLSATNSSWNDLHPKATVDFAGSIVGTDIAFDIPESLQFVAIKQSRSFPVDQQRRPSKHLSDGTYTVRAIFDTVTQIDKVPHGSLTVTAGATADFMDPAELTVYATPDSQPAAPEPSSVALLGIGTLSLFG